ncbi:hypothetical protein SLEP1_g52564 [Rubroshorea leprosula]|uniref:Reverse transcriptase domain-containing protein n=1 Tax=Rubroshorea leprosula TaxID=152421 RepID=A0AAV5MAG1_9ROSI|nr:hypothetical protein SLEP1_g52564 [Rubroshorea leprosula]
MRERGREREREEATTGHGKGGRHRAESTADLHGNFNRGGRLQMESRNLRLTRNSPPRRSKNGSRFGFVRFMGVKDRKELERKLDNIWIGDCKLWVNYPRYNDIQQKGRENATMHVPELQVQNRSYAKVVKGHQTSRHGKGEAKRSREEFGLDKEQVRNIARLEDQLMDKKKIWVEKGKKDSWAGFEYNTNKEESTWLEGCYVGTTHYVEMVRNLQEKFYMEGYFTCRVRAMGGRLVLMDCEDKEELKDLVESSSEWLGQWFKKIFLNPWGVHGASSYVWMIAQAIEGGSEIEDYGCGKAIEEKQGINISRELELKDDDVECNRGELGGMSQSHVQQEEEETVEKVANSLEWALQQWPAKKKWEISMGKTNSVYLKSRSAEEGIQRGKNRGRQNKKPKEGMTEPKFIASPYGEIAGESVEDSGIQNCNRALRKQLQSQLVKDIWDLAKRLGATAENDEEILQKINEMEGRDNRSKADLARRAAEEAKKTEVIEGKDFIGVFGEWGEDRLPVYILNIYSSCHLEEKRALWKELLMLITSRKGNWCLGGDFNAARKVGDRVGCRGTTREMREFNSFIQDAGLVDLPLVGRRYTWHSANGQHRSRIDKFLLSDDWLKNWSDLKQWGLGRTVSDHCPLLLKNEKVDWGPKPFKFFDAWLEYPDCKQLISQVWNSKVGSGWMGFRLKEKLKKTKKALKEWSANHMADVDRRIVEAEKNIAELDRKEENSQLTTDDIEIRRSSFLDLWKNMRIKESMLQQKSRKMWLKEGDANTKFYHRSVKGRWRRNEINSIQINGEQFRGVSEIREGVVKYFKGLFTEEEWQRPKLDGINFRQLADKDNDFLMAKFTEEEIQNVVWDCDSTKSPGLDGFNFRFIKTMWEEIKQGVIGFVLEFHEHGKIVRGSNSSFITLIPKVENPQRIEEYRPISLIGVIYKILAKLLANRLRKVIDEAKRKRIKSFLFKVDFEKAYDKVSWDFVDYMLMRTGFTAKWRKWIKECLQSSMISILVNGSPTKQFSVNKGIRQGDPLSPFLFLLVVEGLNGLMQLAVDKDLFKGVRIGNGNVAVSHLQFADDTLFFGEASEENIKAIKCIMRTFELASGLKINFGKIQIMEIGTEEGWQERMAYRLCCKGGELPFKYLGIPIGGNHRKLSMWKPLMESFKKKLASWKSQNLSLGGRITLLNSVLSSLLVYLMSAYLIPKGTLSSLDKIRRNFLWEGSKEEKKIKWVSWERVCRKKECGGLGVKDLRKFNLALMGKWWGRLAKGEEGLWGKVIKGKYGVNGGQWMGWVRDGRRVGSLWWRDMQSLNVGGAGNEGWLTEGFRIKIGEGKGVSFWWDEWCGENCLANIYPRLYALSTGKEKDCQKMGEDHNGTWKWNMTWRRALFQWEDEAEKELRKTIDKVKISPGCADRWEWIHSVDGQYSTTTAYAILAKQGRDDEEEKMSKRVWNPTIPTKVAAFNWKANISTLGGVDQKTTQKGRVGLYMECTVMDGVDGAQQKAF